MKDRFKRYLSAQTDKHPEHWIFLLLLLYFMSILILYIFSYSIDLKGVEFASINYVQLLDKNGHLYLNPDTFPFFDIIYPPLYPYTLNYLYSILHINIQHDVHGALVVGRAVSFLLGLLNGYLLLRILSLFIPKNKNKTLLLLIGILLLPQHFFTTRPDCFKVSFFMLFLYYTLSYKFNNKNNIYLFIGMICAVIGVFYKHDLAVYIVLFYITAYITYRRKQYLIILFVFLTIVILLFTIGQTLTVGQLYNNLFYYNLQYASSVDVSLFFIGVNALKMLPFLIITFINFKSSNTNVKFIAIIAFIFFALSEFSLLRAGSNLNYTYESIVFMLLHAGIYMNTREDKKTILYRFTLLFYLYFFSFHFQNPPVFSKSTWLTEKKEYQENMINSNTIKEIIKNDTVFFSNPKFIVFNNSISKLYGYDIHFDRYAELYLHMSVDLKTYHNVATNTYDNYFETGGVQYILCENNAEARNQIARYYTKYSFFKKVGNLILYKFNSKETIPN